MPGSSDLTRGNVANTFLCQITISPTICAANTTTVQTFALAGLLTTDQISEVNKPTYQAGLIVGPAACLANNVLSIQFGNFTGAGITPTAGEVYYVEINRPSNPSSLQPSVIQ